MWREARGRAPRAGFELLHSSRHFRATPESAFGILVVIDSGEALCSVVLEFAEPGRPVASAALYSGPDVE